MSITALTQKTISITFFSAMIQLSSISGLEWCALLSVGGFQKSLKLLRMIIPTFFLVVSVESCRTCRAFLAFERLRVFRFFCWHLVLTDLD